MANLKGFFGDIFGRSSSDDPFNYSNKKHIEEYNRYTDDLISNPAKGLNISTAMWNSQQQANDMNQRMLSKIAKQTTQGTAAKQKTWSLYVAMKPVPPDSSVEDAAKQMYESACALAMIEGVKFSIRDGNIATVSRELSLDGESSSIHATCKYAGYAGAVWMEMACDESSYEPFKAMITSLDSGLRVRKINTDDMLDDKHRSLRIASGTPPVWVYRASDMTFDIYRGE